MYVLTCLLVFVAAYMINIVTITVGYHRGLAHGGLRLHPVFKRFVIVVGNWVTGLDPKAWVVMHRMHHAHSDTELDPHSPVNVGILGIFREQLKSYTNVIRGLMKKNPTYTKFAQDLDFELSWLNTRRVWWLPYVIHAMIGLALAAGLDAWLLGGSYLVGMMSHPFQGGMVNALGHAMGGRNFDLPDNSRNNLLAAWLIMGEGFQNNHHKYPSSAKFSYRRNEIDMGYGICRMFDAMKLVTIKREALIPAPPASATAHLVSSKS